MGVISFRISDDMEVKIKEEAKARRMTLAEYCRMILTSDNSVYEEQLSRPTIEAEIEKLEEAQKDFSDLQQRLVNTYLRDTDFMTKLVYHFIVSATSEENAKDVWDKAKKDSEG